MKFMSSKMKFVIFCLEELKQLRLQHKKTHPLEYSLEASLPYKAAVTCILIYMVQLRTAYAALRGRCLLLGRFWL